MPFKAIVPAAGLGRRLWPITRVIPKAMFPIGRYPTIHWVIAEAVASGCGEIAVVVSPRQSSIHEYLIDGRHAFHRKCALTFIEQPEPMGLGHALLLAREFCDGDPTAVLLPDDLTTGKVLPLVQMNPAFRSQGGVVFALVNGSPERTNWGKRWHLRHVKGSLYAIQPRDESSGPNRESSPLVGLGRYLISPESLDEAVLLNFLNRKNPGELDDGMIFEHMFAESLPVHGLVLDDCSFDISTRAGFIGAWQVLGALSPESVFPPESRTPG